MFENDDLRNLIIGFDEENDEIELSAEQIIEFAGIFTNCYYEYSEITDNHKLRSTLKKQIIINQWEFTHKIITSLLELYKKYEVENTLKLLDGLDDKYHINFEKPLKPQIKKLDQKMRQLNNKIKIFKIKLEDSHKNDKINVKIDLDRDALYIERNLELKRSIDPDVTSVSSWVKMVQMSKQKSKDYAKGSNNIKRGGGRN
jgi:hypothetical protein